MYFERNLTDFFVFHRNFCSYFSFNRKNTFLNAKSSPVKGELLRK